MELSRAFDLYDKVVTFSGVDKGLWIYNSQT